MIQVQVKLFATLRETAGWSEKSVELAEGTTVEGLLAALQEAQAALDLAGRPVYAAVNRQYVQRNTVLRNGDEVALFPPVSGGF